MGVGFPEGGNFYTFTGISWDPNFYTFNVIFGVKLLRYPFFLSARYRAPTSRKEYSLLPYDQTPARTRVRAATACGDPAVGDGNMAN